VSELVLQLLVIQVAVPLGLIALNALLPTTSIAGLLARSVAIGLAIVYLVAAGVWLFPPVWAPYCFLVLHVCGSLFSYWKFRKRRQTHRLAWIIWSEPLAGAAGIALAIAGLAPVVDGRTTPSEAVSLAMPLEPGTYIVINGGRTEAVNAHLMTLTGERFLPFRGQSYAVDLIGADSLGFHANGIAPRDPKAYVIYGAGIIAPCAGVIVGATDGLPDMPVPQADREHMAGNHVLLDCKDDIVVLAHMAPGSVAVKVGQSVETGDLLGRVGNSGNTAEPHLHIHVQEAGTDNTPLGGEPVWFTINGRFLLRNDTLRGGERGNAR